MTPLPVRVDRPPNCTWTVLENPTMVVRVSLRERHEQRRIRDIRNEDRTAFLNALHIRRATLCASALVPSVLLHETCAPRHHLREEHTAAVLHVCSGTNQWNMVILDSWCPTKQSFPQHDHKCLRPRFWSSMLRQEQLFLV